MVHVRWARPRSFDRSAVHLIKRKRFFIYPEERECKHPTAHSIIRVFQSTEKYEVTDSDENAIEHFPPSLTSLQKQILNLIKVPLTLYPCSTVVGKKEYYTQKQGFLRNQQKNARPGG